MELINRHRSNEPGLCVPAEEDLRWMDSAIDPDTFD